MENQIEIYQISEETNYQGFIGSSDSGSRITWRINNILSVTNIYYFCDRLYQNIPMQSIEKQIETSIKSKQRGHLIFPDDFSTYGSNDAVRKALERLVEKEIIVRVAQGIYVRPKQSKYVGAIMPSAEEVAEAIAKRDKIRTVPTGSYALNALGLSTQIPMKVVLLTDGSPREIQVGKRSIKLKKTTPKNLLAKGKISRLVIQALKEIGNGKVTESEEMRIIELLKDENPNDLKHDISLAPAWIKKIMKKAL